MKKLIASLIIIVNFTLTPGCDRQNERVFTVGESLNNLYETIKNNDASASYIAHSNVISVLATYPDFVEVLKRGNIELLDLDTMIPQGITTVDDYILFTAYDGENKKTSKCYILNKSGNLLNVADLKTFSHVGGITYDKINNLIWIPDIDGVLNAYEFDDILEENEVYPIYRFDNISDQLSNYLDVTKKNIAYLSIDEQYLYIGSFVTNQKGLVKKFEVCRNEFQEIELKYMKEFKVPSRVQGITFYTFEDEKYMLLSRSYGRRNTSFIQIYKYNERISDYTAIKKSLLLKFPPLLEQITVKSDDLYVIFESGASKYKDCLEKITNICILDLKKIFSRW